MRTKKVKRRWDRDVNAAVAEYSGLFAEGIGGCNRETLGYTVATQTRSRTFVEIAF